MAANMDWLWISAVVLVSVFILVLCWLFFKDYTCCPCRRRRPPIPLDDVESARSRSFDGLPPTPPQAPRSYLPYAPPPLPPPEVHPLPPRRVHPLPPPQAHISTVQSNFIPSYNFRGIVSENDAVQIKNGIPELDLHGLKVWEAKKVTQMFLQQSRGRCRHVRIITGRGLHSLGGIPRIKPEVEMLLKGYTFEEVNKGGCFAVEL